jgi:enamine deaminase RidA (YjgF/YER057c/UK114 family)
MLITRLTPDTLHQNPAFCQAAVIAPGAALVFVGGQNAVNKEGQIVGKDIASQTTQALNNVEAALAAAGATLADVFKLKLYVVQGQPLAEGFAAAQPFFAKVAPPTIGFAFVAGLANPEFLIEIEAVAAVAAREAA